MTGPMHKRRNIVCRSSVLHMFLLFVPLQCADYLLDSTPVITWSEECHIDQVY
jgi:hypothetical protein